MTYSGMTISYMTLREEGRGEGMRRETKTQRHNEANFFKWFKSVPLLAWNELGSLTWSAAVKFTSHEHRSRFSSSQTYALIIRDRSSDATM